MPLQPPSKHEFILLPLTDRNPGIIPSLLSAMEQARVGFAYWDLIKQRIYWSKKLLQFYGLVTEPFCQTYLQYLQWIHPGDQADLEAIVEQVLQTAQPEQFEYRVVASPYDRWFRSSFTPGIEFGETTHLIEVVHDITDVKTAQQMLIDSEARWQKLLGCISDVLIETTLWGEIITATDAITQLWGYLPVELRGVHLLSIVEFENPSFQELINLVHLHPLPVSVGVCIRHKALFREMTRCIIFVDKVRQTLSFLFHSPQPLNSQLHSNPLVQVVRSLPQDSVHFPFLSSVVMPSPSG